MPPTRDRFLIQRAAGAAGPAHPEDVPMSVLAALLGVQDFLHMLPELSARREWLQARRRRTDAEIVGRFGGHWRSAVPSPHMALHESLRGELLAVLSRSLGALPDSARPGGRVVSAAAAAVGPRGSLQPSSFLLPSLPGDATWQPAWSPAAPGSSARTSRPTLLARGHASSCSTT